ncbi:uncharacterized protein LOC132565065 [Ylistrum balloti]|uniref:uncharacterized protein LOC132565065 n=1 Tax=Ylistrum balloti TaxID=509963 RepID=UPI002905BEB3|nr:uncharacterized protein LOC132565065 [Ylistrum balloti]XP_060085654.1 uncharacterized protein LOC132565065 [Ylistrum balloti]
MFLPTTAAQMLAMETFAFDKMKSSRRKQSKPIRVSYSADSEGGADPGAAFPQQKPPEVQEEFVNGAGSPGLDSEGPMEEDQRAMNLEQGSPVGQQMPPSDRELSSPLEGKQPTPVAKEMDSLKEFPSKYHHLQQISEEKCPPIFPDMEAMRDSFPTKYHQLGSELYQGNQFDPNGEENGSELSEQNANSDDSSQKYTDPNEEGRKLNGSGRIFHQDAYCEICDREFCNKYFLKTHKANKHGIFDPASSPFSMNTLPPSMSLPQELSPPQPVLPPPPPTLPPSSASSFKVMDFIQSLPASEPKPPKPAEPAKPPKPEQESAPVSSGNSTGSSSNSGKVGKDMEDFCELCQKHFCNKYYLKKHKQDVHGIAPPEGSSTGKRGGGRSKDLQAQLDAITSSAVASATSIAPPMIPHSMANMAGLPNMPGVMVLNPFMAPMLIPAGSLMPPHSQLPTPPGMSQPLPMPASSPESSTTTTTSASLPSTPSDPMRGMGREMNSGMGVLNTEAYCELCRKEFCNKYFLKVHKANKHGMYLDEFPLGVPIGSVGLPGTPFKPASSIDSTAITSETPVSYSNTELSKMYVKPESSPKPGTSLVTSSASQDNYVTYCNLCNQEFASKYTYRIHRIQVHGMLHEGLEGSLTEEFMRNVNSMREKEEAMAKISPGSRMMEEPHVENKVPENGMTTMFGNMVAAKLADRVTCDICNKELCNKYFLKVHKYKVHGVGTPNTEKQDKANKRMFVGDFETIKNGKPIAPKMRSERPHHVPPVKSEPKDFSLHSPQLPSSLPLPVLPKASEVPTDLSPSAVLEKPSHDELVKMGIDPEAYCEICKKEFCSKYFLRTHRLNIHGIRSEKSESPEMEKFSLANFMKNNNIINNNNNNNSNNVNNNISMSNSMNNNMNNIMSNNMNTMMNNNNNIINNPNNNKPLNLSMSGNQKGKSGYEKHTWRWKEPVNSSRVSCDICNKEVCNKYFLRTHKLNKHGILPSESSLSPSLNNSPTTSDVETSSNSSLPTDLSIRDRNNGSPLGVRLDSNMLRMNEERLKQKMHDAPARNLLRKMEDEAMASRYFNHYSEVCYLCDRRFKSSKWLKAHIMKDHAGMIPGMPMGARKNLMTGFDMSMEQRTCRLCDAVFPSELSMHLHMIQEHNAQVSLNTSQQSPSPPSPPETPFENAPMPLPKRYLTGPKFSLKRRFSTKIKQRLYTCSICDYKSKWLNNVCSHEVKVHQIINKENMQVRQRSHGLIVRKTVGDIKTYRCITCKRSFPSPILCHHHIREEHIRKRTFKVNNRKSTKRLSCNLCNFSTGFSKQLQHHMARVHTKRHVMSSVVNNNGLSMDDDDSGNIVRQQGSLHAQAVEDLQEDMSSDDQQSFHLEDCSSQSDFLTSVVKIPVKRRLSAPVTVTFLLTPMEQ